MKFKIFSNLSCLFLSILLLFNDIFYSNRTISFSLLFLLIILIVYNLYKTIRIDKTKISLFEDSSHELRTPLNAILNYTLFTKEDLEVKEPNLASDLGIVYKSGIDLLYYIDALQSIYKNNRIQQEVNLENLVKEISIKVETNYSNTNNKFSLNIQNSIPLLKKDSFKIEWIVYQFLTNSFKNTNSGQISLNLSKDKNSIHIQVKDNGRGIEEMILNKLNLLFSQNLESLLKKPKGEKLGLYLSALFAKTLNGKIEILSNEKEGSIFTFIFPIE